MIVLIGKAKCNCSLYYRSTSTRWTNIPTWFLTWLTSWNNGSWRQVQHWHHIDWGCCGWVFSLLLILLCTHGSCVHIVVPQYNSRFCRMYINYQLLNSRYLRMESLYFFVLAHTGILQINYLGRSWFIPLTRQACHGCISSHCILFYQCLWILDSKTRWCMLYKYSELFIYFMINPIRTGQFWLRLVLTLWYFKHPGLTPQAVPSLWLQPLSACMITWHASHTKIYEVIPQMMQ